MSFTITRNKSKDSPFNTWSCSLRLYGEISAVTWPLIKLQCNHNASLFTHSERVLQVPEVQIKKSDSISCVYVGATRESTGLYILKTEHFRSGMKSSMEKVMPWAGVLLLAVM